MHHKAICPSCGELNYKCFMDDNPFRECPSCAWDRKNKNPSTYTLMGKFTEISRPESRPVALPGPSPALKPDTPPRVALWPQPPVEEEFPFECDFGLYFDMQRRDYEQGLCG